MNKVERSKQRAICQRIFRQKKRESWERYVSKLDTSVSAWQVWNMVKKISGKNSTAPLKPMIARNGDVLTTKPEIAAEIAKTIAFNSSSENLPPGFAHVNDNWTSDWIFSHLTEYSVIFVSMHHWHSWDEKKSHYQLFGKFVDITSQENYTDIFIILSQVVWIPYSTVCR